MTSIVTDRWLIPFGPKYQPNTFATGSRIIIVIFLSVLLSDFARPSLSIETICIGQREYKIRRLRYNGSHG